MLDIYYSATSVFALFILFIINRSVFSNRRPGQRYDEYQWFVQAVGLFLLVDSTWGFVHSYLNSQIIFMDAVLYNIAMILAVYTCCCYVCKFLELQQKKVKILKYLGSILLILDLVALVANFFTPIMFWVDAEGNYCTGIARTIGIGILITLFVVMALTTFFAIGNTEGERRSKIISIFFFSLVLTVSLIVQGINPIYPYLSVGLVLANVIVYVQIHVAEQTYQLEKITRLKNRLEESHEQLEKSSFELKKQKRMLESSGIATWELTIKEGCRTRLKTDAKMKELMGLPADTNLTEEEMCEMLVSRINPQDVPSFMEYDQKLRSGIRCECTYRWNNPILGERYVRCGGTSVLKNEGETVCYGYHYDVTEMTMLEKELKISLAASEAKTKFIQNMSHEIRTPLNAMFGFSQLLGMPDGTWTDNEKEKYNRIIFNSFEMLEMLVNDILDSADVQHGNYRMEMSQFIVNDVCENAMMSVEFRRPGNVEMKFTSDLADNHAIYSDSRRIQQILVNFLTNACKHTAKGEIHLHVTDKEIPGKIVFSCSDTGHGVPADQAEAIFGRYTKLDQNVQGSGLGLNICNIIAGKLDAKVYLDTSYTGGACFKLEIANK